MDVEFTVAENGRVKDASVRAASIPGVFEESALKAVSQMALQTRAARCQAGGRAQPNPRPLYAALSRALSRRAASHRRV